MNKTAPPQLDPEIFQSLPAEVQAYLVALQTYYQAQLDELNARLNQNSQNSSKPPSADPPWQRPPKKSNSNSNSSEQTKSKGGQSGHTRHSRALLPVEEVDYLQAWWPEKCARCEGALEISDQLGEPVRHQIWEIQRVRAKVSEHQLYACVCPSCAHLTRHPHPPGVPRGSFGPELSATIAALHGRYRISMREIEEIARDLWQVEISVGAIADVCHKVSEALEPAYLSAQTQMQASQMINVDETGWYESGKRAWLWVAVSAVAVVFMVAASRSRASLQALIGANYAGIVHSDRYNAYYALVAQSHQLCWAHLLRNLRGLAQRAGPGQAWSQASLALASQIFKCWDTCLSIQSEQSRAVFQQQLEPIQAEFKKQLEVGQTNLDPKVASFSREVLKLEERLWIFVKVPGVSPTNNAAERALRPAVIWRKTCYGSQSANGSRFVERMLSVEATCQIQKRSFLDFVVASLKAKWFNEAPPALFEVALPS